MQTVFGIDKIFFGAESFMDRKEPFSMLPPSVSLSANKLF
jgi:hypothetical protein